MNIQLWFRFLSLAAAVLLLATSVFAQGYRASIAGRVTDPTGSGVPNATVRAIDAATNQESRATTSDEGLYVITFLLPGTYKVTAEAPGFKTAVREDVLLQINDRRTIDLPLQIGEIKESVTVGGEAPLLTPESASLGQVISNKTIVELPLNGRNPFTLQQLVSGVIPTGQSGNVNLTRPWDTNSVSDISVSGAPNRGNMLTLNGVYAKGGNQVAYTPSIDAVQEFKVQKNSYDAEYGHVAGATINVATKSGTNALHGTLYEFLRNDKFDANSFFANRVGARKQKFRMNQFGATAGGPVLLPKIYNGKNKTFWFFNWESVRQSTPPSTLTTTVPTEAQRTGDFSALRTPGGAPITIFDPTSTRPDPSRPNQFLRTPFSGNRIPTERINAVARNVLSYIPAPNRPGDPVTGANNFISTSGGTLGYDQYGARIDHSFGEKSRLFGMVGIANFDQDNPSLFDNLATASARFQNTRTAAIDYVRNFSASHIFNLRVGYARKYEGSLPGSSGFNPAALGFPQGLASQLPALVFPLFSIGDATSLGSSGPSYNASDGHNVNVSFTRTKGRHTLKYGMYFLLLREYDGRGSDSGSAGTYSFGRNWTQENPITASANSGWGLATFMLGVPSGGQVGIGAFQALQTSFYEWFVQDDVKLTPRLTMNLGLRWEYQGATTDRYNKVYRAFDYDYVPSFAAAAKAAYAAAPIPQLPVSDFRVAGGTRFAGRGDQPRSYLEPELSNWAPRIGLAYRAANRLVWRAGFGVFYNPRLTGVDSTGFNTATPMVTTLDSVTPVGSLSNPFPNGLNLVPCANGSPECLAGVTGNFRNPRPTTPKTVNYSTGFQLELPWRWLLDAAYVGSVTSRFNPTWAINAPPARFLSLGLELLRPVPNPFFGLIPASVGALGARTVPLYQLLAPYPFYNLGGPLQPGVGHTRYDSLQMSAERRFTADFGFLASYTFSKLMSRQNYMNTGFSDVFESTILDIDRPHRLVLNGIWELPFGEGKRFRTGSAAANKVIGGWQFSGVASFQSGGPIRTPGGAIATGQPVRLSTEPTIDKWFNTGAFIVQPGLPQPLGQRTLTLYLGDFRNHGINNFDLSVAKNTKITEGVRLQFRSEFFNAFNRVQWGNPDTGITSSNYGRINSQANIPRQIQFGLKLIF